MAQEAVGSNPTVRPYAGGSTCQLCLDDASFIRGRGVVVIWYGEILRFEAVHRHLKEFKHTVIQVSVMPGWPSKNTICVPCLSGIILLGPKQHGYRQGTSSEALVRIQPLAPSGIMKISTRILKMLIMPG